jgi:catechol 2,3-dioxygenase-like lactoylglutathione lyase family enzyme
MRLHHVQVACPPGAEPEARRFYAEGLGMTEVEKPVALRGRGGAWFRALDSEGAVTAEIHVGVEARFSPARKAHPALVLDSVAELVRTATRLDQLGFDIDQRERHSLPGYERLHAFDGHGNRVELLCDSRSSDARNSGYR